MSEDIRLDKNSFIRIVKNRDILEDYEFIKELGSGTNGIVFEAIHMATGQRRAVKAMCKDQFENEDVLKNELSILMSMDHPNIVKLYDVYEYKNDIYIVQEICDGGELFFYITHKTHLTEAQAAKIMRQMFSAVAYLHSMKVCHRDLKPENFLLKYENDDSNIKLIDFGLSCKLRENEVLEEPSGTPFYLAPEMLDGHYTETIDNWALGVILYIMLSGSPPFFGPDGRAICQAIQKGVYTFALKPFQKCSVEVKDLISKLLVRNKNKRYTAIQAYNHPWVQQQVEVENKSFHIELEVIQKLGDFIESQSLKKAILLYVAQQIPENEIEHLKTFFVRIDTNGDGQLSIDEFENAWGSFQETLQLKQKFTKQDIRHLFKAVDANNNGVIDYSEFIAVFAEHHVYKTEKYLKMVFERFDLDKNGKINQNELRKLLGGGSFVPIAHVEDIIKQADMDGDGELDFNEVLKYIKEARAH